MKVSEESRSRHRNPMIVKLEISENVFRFFSESSGGSNRQWVNRFRSMVNYHGYLKQNATNKQKRDELRGYEMAMEKFFVFKNN